jgi:hypothetical protein
MLRGRASRKRRSSDLSGPLPEFAEQRLAASTDDVAEHECETGVQTIRRAHAVQPVTLATEGYLGETGRNRRHS